MSLESARSAVAQKQHMESPEQNATELAEGLDLDPRVKAIRAELVTNWEKTYGNGKSIIDSGEGQDYLFGDLLAYKRGERPVTIEQRAEQEFARRFPEDAAVYAEKEQTRIYETGSDPLIRKITNDINTAASTKTSEDLAGKNSSYEQREASSDYFRALALNQQTFAWRRWDSFLDQYPEKAAAYRNSNSGIANAFERRESRNARDEQEAQKANSETASVTRSEVATPAPQAKEVTLAETTDETRNDNLSTVPPQYAGMTAEAVDIAWTVPQNIDPEKTKQEQERKARALAFLRVQETGKNSEAATVERRSESAVQNETTASTESNTENAELTIETLLAQGNSAAAIRKATERLSSNTEFDELAFQKEINNFLRRRSWLHNELARRGSEDLSWMLKDYAPHSSWYQEAKTALETHFKNEGIETAETPAWFSITASKRREGNESGSRYKVYETLAVNDFQSIAKLPALVKKLQTIGAETGESIKIKTPRSFNGFITDNDSLVAHCDSEDTCYKIKRAISEWQSEQGLAPTKRELDRTTIALDGKINGNDEDTSFSELVSNQITTWAKEHKDNFPADLLAKEAIKHAILLSQKTPTPSAKIR